MKIAFIGQKGIPTQQGGIEKHVEELSIRLADLGFDVTVYSRPHYTGDTRKSYEYKGVKIINLPSIKTKNLDAISHTFIATIHALFQDYDIIHYHGVGPSLLSFIPRIFKPKTKVISTFHCIDRQHQKWGLFAKIMLAMGEWAACYFPHETIAISQILKKYCYYRFDKEVNYIPNGVFVNNTNKNKDAKWLKKNNLKSGNYIITVSRLIKHKGIHTLIDAYNKLGKINKKLVIVGSGSNTDDYVKQIKNLAKNNKNIIFTGLKSGEELEAIFRNAELFIQPSETEGLSIALLEAMAYGVPAIISNIEENLEPAGGYAIEFINKDSNDLASKLKYALTHKSEMKQLAIKAKARANKDYNWDNIAKNTAKLYCTLAHKVEAFYKI